MITLTDVSFAYPEAEFYALEDVDFTAGAGELIGVLGASGAGKSTLAKILSGFIPHAEGGQLSGQVLIDGVDLTGVDLADAVAKVGLVIQNPFNQISGAKFTVREEIAFGLENLGRDPAAMLTRVEHVAEQLAITHLLDASPFALSGGQQQLVAIASMLVLGTPVIVMDEPTSQLDPRGTRMVFTVLQALKRSGATIVVFEHKVEHLFDVADRIDVIAGKTIRASGTPGDILTRPELTDWGVAPTRFTEAARAARKTEAPGADSNGTGAGGVTGGRLPVSLAGAVEFFSAGTTGGRP